MSSPRFYVSAIDGPRRYILAGPYASHETAQERVRAVRRMAEDQNPRAVFMAFGTCSEGGSGAPIDTPLGAEWTP